MCHLLNVEVVELRMDEDLDTTGTLECDVSTIKRDFVLTALIAGCNILEIIQPAVAHDINLEDRPALSRLYPYLFHCPLLCLFREALTVEVLSVKECYIT